MKKYFIIFLFSALIFISCKDSVVNGDPPVTTDDFPNQQGNMWKYLVTDSLANTTDTLTVTVNGTTTLSTGEGVTIWELNYSDRIDSNFILLNNDTVKIYQDREYLIDNIKLVFPLTQGSGWRGDFISDTSYVVSVSAYTVPAGSFASVYTIERIYGGFNEYRRMMIWFVPKVGIIRMNIRDEGFTFQNETWELLDYDLN